MTTNILTRIFRKPKAKRLPDDNIERHEPDRFLGVFYDFLVGIVVTSFLMIIAYSVMMEPVEVWIAHFLAAQDNAFTFEERLAAFTAAVIALLDGLIIVGVAASRTPDNEDVIETVNDQSDEINERFVELENRFVESIEQVRKSIDDLTPGTSTPLDEDDHDAIEQRIGLVSGD